MWQYYKETVSWSTTYFTVYQYGFNLNFVDIDKDTLNIDTTKMRNYRRRNVCYIRS